MNNKYPVKSHYLECIYQYGGKMSEMQKPLIPFFPNVYRKRKLAVSYTSWRGLAPGAVHYYANFRLERNGYWNGKKFVTPWDCIDNIKPELPHIRFKTLKSVKKYVNAWFDENGVKYGLVLEWE